MDKVLLFKIHALPVTDRAFRQLPFGRKIEHQRLINDWKARAKSTHLSQKRQSYRKAIKEFCTLNNVDEYYCSFWAAADYFDDSFEFFYTTKD